VADTGHDRVLVCAPDGEVLAEHGGLYAPQGVCWDGEDLLVCETGAHRVWRLQAGGTGRALVAEGLWSPWDVVVWHGHPVIAEAGRHRLWVVDPAGERQVLAGLGPEELRDGPALEALLAQPSGLAVTGDGELAWVDAESSALRVLDRPGGTVRTLVGYDLFAWGDADGPGPPAPACSTRSASRPPPTAGCTSPTPSTACCACGGEATCGPSRGGLRRAGGRGRRGGGGHASWWPTRATTGSSGWTRWRARRWPSTSAGRGSRDDPAAPVVAETVVAQAGGTLDVELDVELDGDALDPMGRRAPSG
jgi:hypothetical protein